MIAPPIKFKAPKSAWLWQPSARYIPNTNAEPNSSAAWFNGYYLDAIPAKQIERFSLGGGFNGGWVIAMTDIDHIYLAMHIVPLLYVTAFVALCAVVSERREVFVAGSIGAVLASLIPGPVVYTDYSSVEGAVIRTFSDVYSHSLSYGFVSALIGSAAAACLVQFSKPRNPKLVSNVEPSK